MFTVSLDGSALKVIAKHSPRSDLSVPRIVYWHRMTTHSQIVFPVLLCRARSTSWGFFRIPRPWCVDQRMNNLLRVLFLFARIPFSLPHRFNATRPTLITHYREPRRVEESTRRVALHKGKTFSYSSTLVRGQRLRRWAA
jgi:hypothetical protein